MNGSPTPAGTSGGPRLAETYEAARGAILAAADDADVEATAFPHPLPGRLGEEFAIDVLTIGPADADSVLMLVSGTHGVEGYAGLRTATVVARRTRRQPPDVPRRHRARAQPGRFLVGSTGERGQRRPESQLHRLDRRHPRTNDGYGDIADLLVPIDWDVDTQSHHDRGASRVAGEVGLDRFQEIVERRTVRPSDRDLPRRFDGPVWSHRWLASHLAEMVGPARRSA